MILTENHTHWCVSLLHFISDRDETTDSSSRSCQRKKKLTAKWEGSNNSLQKPPTKKVRFFGLSPYALLINTVLPFSFAVSPRCLLPTRVDDPSLALPGIFQKDFRLGYRNWGKGLMVLSRFQKSYDGLLTTSEKERLSKDHPRTALLRTQGNRTTNY